MVKLVRFILLLVCLSVYAGAKALNVDELTTKRSQLKIMGAFSYINIQRKNSIISEISTQITQGNFVNIPISSIENLNENYINFSLYGRYGIAKRVEILSTFNGFWQSSTTQNGINFHTQSNADFSSFNTGFLIQAKKESRFPALLLGGTTDIISKDYFQANKNINYFKGYSAFATSYYSIDPIVFFLQASARFSLVKDFKGIKANDGDVFILNPMIYIAINPYTSLNFGIKYQHTFQSKLNGTAITPQLSSLGYVFGVAYEIKADWILFANAESLNTNSYSSDSFTLMLSYRI